MRSEKYVRKIDGRSLEFSSSDGTYQLASESPTSSLFFFNSSQLTTGNNNVSKLSVKVFSCTLRLKGRKMAFFGCSSQIVAPRRQNSFLRKQFAATKNQIVPVRLHSGSLYGKPSAGRSSGPHEIFQSIGLPYADRSFPLCKIPKANGSNNSSQYMTIQESKSRRQKIRFRKFSLATTSRTALANTFSRPRNDNLVGYQP